MQMWKEQPLLVRIRHLRYILPPSLALLVVGYQLGVAQALERSYGHLVHYGVEIAFYSLAGPVVTWLTLAWVEGRLAEKEALEQEVRARDQHLATLTAASADAILSLDGAGQITSWNQGAAKMFGYRPEAIIGQPIINLLPDAPVLADRLGRDGVIQNYETLGLKKDGQAITVELTQTMLNNQMAEAPASSLIMRDVTLRRQRNAILEEERARIARDLHDGVAQTLYFLALKADMAGQQLHQDPGSVAVALEEIGRQTRRIIREVRRTIFALRPLDWTQGGFLPALRRFSRDFAEQLGWQLTFEADDESLAIPPKLEPTLFRLVQESLNNVAKHANAKQVWINLYGTEILTLTVRDDGQGFDRQATNNNGLGLRQMRQRTEAVGGTFKLESEPEKGTVITAHLLL